MRSSTIDITVSRVEKTGKLFAISDLHVNHPENRLVVERLRPESPFDWLVIAGDVSESIEDLEWALGLLKERFSTVLWVPGNHDLWTLRDEKPPLGGEQRYRHLVDMCREIGVVTAEDPYPIWRGPGGPATVAPLFLLYDYSFGVNVAPTKEQSLALAHAAGVVCSDEFLLLPDPYSSREAWCHARVRQTEARLEARDVAIPTVLINHFPLLAASTRRLFYPQFAQWCGTTLTADWHQRFQATAVVYGHLHIPGTAWHDGVRFEEVSLGYPREWHRRERRSGGLREILPGRGRT